MPPSRGTGIVWVWCGSLARLARPNRQLTLRVIKIRLMLAASPTNPLINSSIHSIRFESSVELSRQSSDMANGNKKTKDYKLKIFQRRTFLLARLDFFLPLEGASRCFGALARFFSWGGQPIKHAAVGRPQSREHKISCQHRNIGECRPDDRRRQAVSLLQGKTAAVVRPRQG